MEKSIPLQITVKIFLKNSKDKYLLLKRSSVRYPNIKNGWDIPGGRIIPGTALLENIKREVLEETKLSVKGLPKLIAAQDILRKDKHIVRLTFLGKASGEPTLEEEHIEYQWFTPKEMLHMKELDEFTRDIIESNLIK